MSRFADPNATKRFDIGTCQCPGTPHESDWIDLRSSMGTADALAMAEAEDSVGILGLLIRGWNLLDNDGNLAEVNAENIGLLYGDVFTDLDAWINDNVQTATLPNGSAVRSANGSRASGSPTRATRKRG